VAKLVYSAITSLDGYVADAEGNFDWAKPDDEVHRAVNEQEREIGTYLYGRRLYEVMAVWETWDLSGEPSVEGDYQEIWRAAEKIVYSRSLESASTGRTRIERDFDPDAVRTMKAESERDLSVGGAELAGQALRAGLVDEIHLFASPVIVGAGKRALPEGARIELELIGERRFGNGVVHVHYAKRSQNST
jgi:dihydrofolate reductase